MYIFKIYEKININDISVTNSWSAALVDTSALHTRYTFDDDSMYTDAMIVYKNTTGNSGMATGGSGDVLSGIIASLSAQGLAPYDAALSGAIIHSEAGLMASSVMAEESVLPSDVITCLSAVFKELRS